MAKTQVERNKEYHKKIVPIRFILSLKDLEGIKLPSDMKEVRSVAKNAILNKYSKENKQKDEIEELKKRLDFFTTAIKEKRLMVRSFPEKRNVYAIINYGYKYDKNYIVKANIYFDYKENMYNVVYDEQDKDRLRSEGFEILESGLLLTEDQIDKFWGYNIFQNYEDAVKNIENLSTWQLFRE